MAGLARPAKVLLAVALGCSAAGAGPERFRVLDPPAPIPLGSFESAGIAVFVRAHEARRHSLAPAAKASGRLSPAIVAMAVPVDSLDMSGEAEIDLPSSTGTIERRRWVAPSDGPGRPGTLTPRDPAEAAPFSRSGLLEAHRTPDLELEVSKRTTLGVFGEAGKIEATDIRNATTRTTRDLGAGVTLQYRFGE